MARGDVKLFASYIQKSKDGVAFDLTGDSIKLGIVTNAIVPTVGLADPRWGAGGGTDLSVNQVVANAGGYPAPIALAGITYAQAAGVLTFDANDIAVAQDADGFTNGAYGILYDDTVAGKYAIGFVDLGGPVSIQSGALNIAWNAAGIFTETAT